MADYNDFSGNTTQGLIILEALNQMLVKVCRDDDPDLVIFIARFQAIRQELKRRAAAGGAE